MLGDADDLLAGKGASHLRPAQRKNNSLWKPSYQIEEEQKLGKSSRKGKLKNEFEGGLDPMQFAPQTFGKSKGKSSKGDSKSKGKGQKGSENINNRSKGKGKQTKFLPGGQGRREGPQFDIPVSGKNKGKGKGQRNRNGFSGKGAFGGKGNLMLPDVEPFARRTKPQQSLSWRGMWEYLGEGLAIETEQWDAFHNKRREEVASIRDVAMTPDEVDKDELQKLVQANYQKDLVTFLKRHLMDIAGAEVDITENDVQMIDQIYIDEEYEYFRFRVDEVNFYDSILGLAQQFVTDPKTGFTKESCEDFKLDKGKVALGYWNAIITVLDSWDEADSDWEGERQKKNRSKLLQHKVDMGVGNSFEAIKKPMKWTVRPIAGEEHLIISDTALTAKGDRVGAVFGQSELLAHHELGLVLPWWRENRSIPKMLDGSIKLGGKPMDGWDDEDTSEQIENLKAALIDDPFTTEEAQLVKVNGVLFEIEYSGLAASSSSAPSKGQLTVEWTSENDVWRGDFGEWSGAVKLAQAAIDDKAISNTEVGADCCDSDAGVFSEQWDDESLPDLMKLSLKAQENASVNLSFWSNIWKDHKDEISESSAYDSQYDSDDDDSDAYDSESSSYSSESEGSDASSASPVMINQKIEDQVKSSNCSPAIQNQQEHASEEYDYEQAEFYKALKISSGDIDNQEQAEESNENDSTPLKKCIGSEKNEVVPMVDFFQKAVSSINQPASDHTTGDNKEAPSKTSADKKSSCKSVTYIEDGQKRTWDMTSSEPEKMFLYVEDDLQERVWKLQSSGSRQEDCSVMSENMVSIIADVAEQQDVVYEQDARDCARNYINSRS